MELNKSNIKKILLLVACSVFIVYVIFNFSTFLSITYTILKIFSPFIVGCCIAFVISIPMNFFEKNIFNHAKFFRDNKVGFTIKRITSIIISLAFVFVIITGVAFVIIPELTGTFEIVSAKIPTLLSRIQTYILDLLERFPSIANEINSFAKNWENIRQNLLSFVTTGIWGVSGVIGTVFNGVATTVLALIFSFYILAQKEVLGNQFIKLFYAIFREKEAASIINILNRISKTFSSFISGQCIEAIIEGIIFFFVLSIFGFPSAAVIGVIVGFTALIPIVGTFIGAILSTFIILVFDPIKAIIFIIIFFVLQQVTNNLIYPRVVGSSIGLPGIWVMLAVTVGGSWFGIIGMLFMVPTFSILYTFFNEYIDKRIKNKKIPNNLIK